MLSPQERYEIMQQLQRVHHNSAWGLAIKNFIALFPSKTEEEVFNLIRGLQSQIDDNPLLMKEILGSSFSFFDKWKRTTKNLNIRANIEYLMKAAISRSSTKKEAAYLLGITERTFYTYKKQFKL